MINFSSYFSSSAGNLYTLESGAGRIIIDPGVQISAIKKSLGFGLSRFDGAIVSHGHMDHCRGVPGLLSAGIDCYMLGETADKIKASGHRVHIVQPEEQFRVAGLFILPFSAQHDIPNIGFLVSDGQDKLVFLIDSFYCRKVFRGLSHIAIGVNWSKQTMAEGLNHTRKKRLYSSHMSLETAVEFLNANDMSSVREIHILHLSKDNSDPGLFRETIMRATGKPVYIGGSK